MQNAHRAMKRRDGWRAEQWLLFKGLFRGDCNGRKGEPVRARCHLIGHGSVAELQHPGWLNIKLIKDAMREIITALRWRMLSSVYSTAGLFISSLFSSILTYHIYIYRCYRILFL